MKLLRYSLVAVVCALVIPAAAQGATIINNGGGAITFNDNANATPYPSELPMTGGNGPVSNVAVFVTLTHTNITDVDLVLVSPTGKASILMSDACGTGNLSSRTFIFASSGASALPQNGPCPAGTYQPTNYDTADNWPAPGPGAVTSASFSSFGSTSANGDWQLFARDDAPFPGGPQGEISAWGMSITTGVAPNVVPALGNSVGVASPYPSAQTFNTPDGQVIDDLNLTVTAFNHEHPDDVDMMLQGPGGQTAMVMSDACGSKDIGDNFTFIFDDEATLPFSDTDEANCLAGSKKPSDFGDTPENMPAPAPPRPYGASMAAFDGLPGGEFRLWVNDDSGGDIGYFNGWNLTMTTRPLATMGFAANAVPAAEGQTAQLSVIRTGTANLGAATVDVAVNDADTDSSDFSHSVPTKLQFANGETTKTIDIPINGDFEGEPTETFQVALSNATGDAALTDLTSFATVTIAKSDPDNRFTIGQAVRKRNGSAVIPVTVPSLGTLKSDDAGPKDLLKTSDTFAESAGTINLKVKPASKAKRKLRRGQKVKVTAAITFTPDGGSPNSKEAPVALKKKG